MAAIPAGDIRPGEPIIQVFRADRSHLATVGPLVGIYCGARPEGLRIALYDLGPEPIGSGTAPDLVDLVPVASAIHARATLLDNMPMDLRFAPIEGSAGRVDLRLLDRRVGAAGIVALALTYDSEDLQDARRRHDGKLVVPMLVDPRNVNSVLVRLPDASLPKVGTPRSPWTGVVTLREHYAALGAVRRLVRRPSEQDGEAA